MKKQQKVKKPSSEQNEDLALLASRPEFKAFDSLAKIEEHNIVVASFKENSSNPDLRVRKAWYEGRMYELRKIMKTFEESRKNNEE